MSFLNTATNTMASRGELPALIVTCNSSLVTLTYKDLAARSRSFANGLLQLGLRNGKPVILIGPNGFEWVIARLALDMSGALAVPMDELATQSEIRAVLAQSKATCIICASANAEVLRNLDSTLSIIAFGEIALPDGVMKFSDLFHAPVQDLPSMPAESPVMLAYTSGTTGAPKAIVLTRSNIETNVRALLTAHLVGPGDRVLLPLPLQHVYPFIVGVLVSLNSGATVVFPSSMTGPGLLEAIKLAKVSVIVGVPRLYTAICSGLIARVEAAGFAQRYLVLPLLTASSWLRRNVGMNCGRLLFSSLRARFGKRLRLLVSGGARLDPETLRMLIGLGFDVRSGYGLAETASMFTGNLPGRERWGSEGKPIAGHVRISAPDSSGIGGIELKGPQVFSHYLDDPEATRLAFTEDGWFRSGDNGRIDRDGFLYVSGRAKDTLVLGGGMKVNPEELEKLYGTSRYIREIAIFEHRGSLAALVVPSLEATRAGGAIHIDTAIRVDLASRAHTLASYQRLAGFAITREPLPRTRLGKYRRFLLPALYERARNGAALRKTFAFSAEDEALLRQPAAKQVYDILVKHYPHGQLGLDASPLIDLGIDSLEWISFGLELEDRLKLRLTEKEIGGIVTVRDLLNLVIQAPVSTISPSSPPRDWIGPTGPGLRSLGVLLYALNWLVMHALFRLRVDGVENVPPHRNVIFVANHASYLDPSAIAAALSYRVARPTYWAGDPTLLFSKSWQEPFMRAMHCFPADERAPAQTLSVSETLLRQGYNLVWFPEGWRSPDGQLQPFLPGIGHLLMRSPVPVVPIYIEGAFEALPRDRTMPRLRKIQVFFGKPIQPADWEGLHMDKTDAPKKIANFLQRAIDTLDRKATLLDHN